MTTDSRKNACRRAGALHSFSPLVPSRPTEMRGCHATEHALAQPRDMRATSSLRRDVGRDLRSAHQKKRFF
jgi:hypothetical protein